MGGARGLGRQRPLRPKIDQQELAADLPRRSRQVGGAEPVARALVRHPGEVDGQALGLDAPETPHGVDVGRDVKHDAARLGLKMGQGLIDDVDRRMFEAAEDLDQQAAGL